MLEAALRTLERTYRWGPSGLLFTAGWGPSYFERTLGVASPIPPAKGLSDFELPAIDDYDLCLHLACDDEQRLAAVEAALMTAARRSRRGRAARSLARALRWRETRTGFVGAGLPAAHQDVGGIPPGNPVPQDSPLFMGFKSSLRRNQATEDVRHDPRRTVRGRHDDAGQLHAPAARQLVRTARPSASAWRCMYAPQVTPEQVEPLHHRRRRRSRPARPGDRPLRRDRARTDLRARPAQRQAADHPPRLRHRRRRPGGPALRLAAAHDRGLRHHPQRDERELRAARKTRRSPTRSTTASTRSSSFSGEPTTSCPPRPERSFPLLPGRERALA